MVVSRSHIAVLLVLLSASCALAAKASQLQAQDAELNRFQETSALEGNNGHDDENNRKDNAGRTREGKYRNPGGPDPQRGSDHDSWRSDPGRDGGPGRGRYLEVAAAAEETVAGSVFYSQCTPLDTPEPDAEAVLLCPHPDPGNGGKAQHPLEPVSSARTAKDGSFHISVLSNYASILHQCVVKINRDSISNCQLPPDTGEAPAMAISTATMSTMGSTAGHLYSLQPFTFWPKERPASCNSDIKSKRNLLEAREHNHEIVDSKLHSGGEDHLSPQHLRPRQQDGRSTGRGRNMRKLLDIDITVTVPPIPAIPPLPKIPAIPPLPAIPPIPEIPPTGPPTTAVSSLAP